MQPPSLACSLLFHNIELLYMRISPHLASNTTGCIGCHFFVHRRGESRSSIGAVFGLRRRRGRSRATGRDGGVGSESSELGAGG